jgi:hypothetical protein
MCFAKGPMRRVPQICEGLSIDCHIHETLKKYNKNLWMPHHSLSLIGTHHKGGKHLTFGNLTIHTLILLLWMGFSVFFSVFSPSSSTSHLPYRDKRKPMIVHNSQQTARMCVGREGKKKNGEGWVWQMKLLSRVVTFFTWWYRGWLTVCVCVCVCVKKDTSVRRKDGDEQWNFYLWWCRSMPVMFTWW